MFNRIYKSCSGLSEGLLDKAPAKEDKSDHCQCKVTQIYVIIQQAWMKLIQM